MDGEDVGIAPTSPLSRPDAHDNDQPPPDPDAAKKAPDQQPPPTLPGSHAQPTPVVPPSKDAVDLNPNDALFDAINRGDTVAARDALGRGADINAKNVLGQTPLEASVDLGRNDISFLLLSLRPAPEVADRSPARTARGRAADASSHVVAAKVDAGPAAAVPSAGFLGFGGGS